MSVIACSQQLSLWRIWGTTRIGLSTATTDQLKLMSCRDWSRSFRDFDPDGRSTSHSGKANLRETTTTLPNSSILSLKTCYPSGKIEEVRHAFDLMEYWLKNGDKSVRELVVIGFLEDLQNLASRQAFAKEAFVPFLGSKSREAWDELERLWGAKATFAEVIGETSRLRSKPSMSEMAWLHKLSANCC